MTENTTTQTLIQHVDPRALVPSTRNARTDLGELTELAASIAASGVLEPLVVARDDDGQTIVLAGHRRAAAAIEAGVETVPVVYRDDLAGDVEQLTVILSENLHRRGLSDVETVRAVQQMIDLGESGASIARRTGLAKSRTTRLARVARSTDEVRDALSEHNLTLDQAIALDEVKDDPDALADLLAWADDPGTFDARAREYRAAKKMAKKITETLTEYAADGITAYAERDEDRPESTRLTDIYGWAMDAEERAAAHADCPHRVLIVSGNVWRESIHVSEHCTDAEQHPEYVEARQEQAERLARYSQAEQASDDPEAKKAERRRVIANNKAMDAANAHRLGWLADFLAAKRPALGKNPATLLAALYTEHLSLISPTGVFLDDALREVGWKHGTPGERAQSGTAHGYLFAVVAAAVERNTDRETWRHGHAITRHAAWVKALTGLGYEPTAIEQAIVDGAVDAYTDEG